MRAVEPGHGMGILGKMRRDPIENHSDAMLMTAVDQLHQIFRFAEARGRRVEVGNLVAPGRTVGMLGQRQKFDVGEPHLQHIGNQLVGQVPVGQEAAVRPVSPRTGVDLVNGHRSFPSLGTRSPLHPLAIAPLMLAGRIVHHAGGAGWRLGVESIGIGFQEQGTIAGQNLELVQIAFAQTGHEQLPDSRPWPQAHRMAAAIPLVEGADHADPPGVGRPDREIDPGDASHRPDVRAEFFENSVVIALGEQVTVLVAEDRVRKGIGVLESPGPAVLGRAQPIAQRLRLTDYPRFAQTAVVDPMQRVQHSWLILAQQEGRFGIRQQGAHHAQARFPR